MARKFTSPGAWVADQENPGELGQDDHKGGQAVLNAPLQNKFGKQVFLNWLKIYLECEICFEGLNQPVKKHKSEVNQEEEAIAILGVLHKNGQLFGPFQQKSGILSLQNSLDQGLVARHISIEEVLMCGEKKVKGEIYH